MNAQGVKGGAFGFKITSLNKVSDIKSITLILIPIRWSTQNQPMELHLSTSLKELLLNISLRWKDLSMSFQSQLMPIEVSEISHL